MGGGAWPFLVGGVICLVNSVNERDPRLLNRWSSDFSLETSSWGDVRSIRRRKMGAITGL